MKNSHKKIKVIMVPNNHAYISELSNTLRKNNIDVVLLPSFHFATITNYFKIALLKLKGYKFIHIQSKLNFTGNSM